MATITMKVPNTPAAMTGDAIFGIAPIQTHVIDFTSAELNGIDYFIIRMDGVIVASLMNSNKKATVAPVVSTT